jgi:hypothetical protein
MGVREASVAEFVAGSSSDVGNAQARKQAKRALTQSLQIVAASSTFALLEEAG